MNGKNVTETELHAYVDGLLEPARRGAVEAYLAAQPSALAQIQQWRTQNQALHREFDDVLNEPIPQRLVQVLHQRSSYRLASAFIWLVFGVTTGWLARGVLPLPWHDSATVAAAHFAHQALVAHVTYTSIMTLVTAAARLDGIGDYAERIEGYIAEMQQRDVRITQCITDAKGDRSRHPGGQSDRDAYVRVVDRTSDGVVIRGAKLHITAASLGHELLTIPTKAMRNGEEEYAMAC